MRFILSTFLLPLVTQIVSLGTAYAQSDYQVWSHQGKPARLIELFTSEGCSSCPPADTYLSKFTAREDLWQGIIPLAYHVDYWDYIGWKDRFAHPSFSQKQRLYRSYGVVASVYTPGFVVDGKEWRGFFNPLSRTLPQALGAVAPKLRLERRNDNYSVTFLGEGTYTAHIAWLAMGEKTAVKKGENRGKILHHDFIVLEQQIADQRTQAQWTFSPNDRDNTRKIDAVAVWLTKPGEFAPYQTVAGWVR
ncbi:MULTISPECIES: DUF1223 domain-containing protein [Vibrio]|uniref:DUF1223 domain-containing protein n=1 Tax=Vibrio halioticoli NBRC 102217 TaxID=1219072 RepID=V5FKE4_9VIBR|nr:MULTISPECIES: DUF1223 domain-containing protein [Vibrio]MPW36457.1 DUF1223 domain-containing protein [Vibrio sp. B1Z05]GAD89357.1 hypothetical protein VHA01S_019_00340 [Vibrio halioticoli NBRC 102217]